MWHTTDDVGRSGTLATTTDMLCATTQVRPKPSKSRTLDIKGNMKLLQQNFVVLGIKRCVRSSKTSTVCKMRGWLRLDPVFSRQKSHRSP